MPVTRANRLAAHDLANSLGPVSRIRRAINHARTWESFPQSYKPECVTWGLFGADREPWSISPNSPLTGILWLHEWGRTNGLSINPRAWLLYGRSPVCGPAVYSLDDPSPPIPLDDVDLIIGPFDALCNHLTETDVQAVLRSMLAHTEECDTRWLTKMHGNRPVTEKTQHVSRDH